MKTQILQLEAHDDAISTRDKIGWSQTARILLVWPNRGRLLTRRLDLVLLLRHSQTLGAQLALVTNDSEVRFHARLLGISTFKAVRQAQNRRWKRPARSKAIRLPNRQVRQERVSHLLSEHASRLPKNGTAIFPPLRLGFFSLGVLALLSIAAALLPSAEITLTPETRTQEITFTIHANPSTRRVNLSGLVPIRQIKVTVEGRDSLATTGNVPVPVGYASGEASFSNMTSRPVLVPAGTVVTTLGLGVRFATDRAEQVPSGPGPVSSIPITALTPGSAGNLAAGRLQAIEGPLGLELSVINLVPTTGGKDASSPAPTPLDRTRLHDQLLAQLRGTALAEMQAGRSPGDILLTIEPTQVRTLEETFDPQGSQPANQLVLNLRLEFEAPIVSGENLTALANAILDSRLPQGYSAMPQTLNIEHLSEPILEKETGARWKVRASRSIRAQLPEEQAAALSLGLTPRSARQRLENALLLSSQPRIVVKPTWWPRLPILPFRISVISIQ